MMHKEMEWYGKGIIKLWYMVNSYELWVIKVPEGIKKHQNSNGKTLHSLSRINTKKTIPTS